MNGVDKIRRARMGETGILTAISFAGKRIWNYPEEYFKIWASELTVTEEYIQKNEVWVVEKDGELVLSMTDEVFDAMTELRRFLYDHVYRAPQVHREFIKAKKILSELYTHFLNNGDGLEKEMRKLEMDEGRPGTPIRERTVCDLIASLTDRYALDLYAHLFFPSPMV